MWIADGWKDYELLDCGGGEKLERWGDQILVRPDPQAIWESDRKNRGWRTANARYSRSSTGGGHWDKNKLPESWPIAYKNLRFQVKPMNFKHTGLFPEQAANWDFAMDQIRRAGRPIRVLNLFAYTGTATCYAADGGVEETVTVDLSNTYLDWAERNMRQNGFVGPQHHFVRDDVLAWIRDQRQTRNRWDLIFVDPPTFSNSSKMGHRTWDVQRDHVELLAGVSRLLAQGGHAIFSCNLRGFRPETRKLARAGVVLEDITAQTIPEDFARNQKVHHCYIVRRLPIEDAMAEVGFSAEEIAERVEELRNPEARKPRAAVPAHAQTGNGKSNFAGKPYPAGKSKKKKFYASKPKGK